MGVWRKYNFSQSGLLISFVDVHCAGGIMIKTTAEVRKDIKKKALAPIYLLHGDEPFFIDELAHAFETEVLSEDQRSFNQFVLFGKDQKIA
jgi:DNA polymerase-3 subunit delta